MTLAARVGQVSPRSTATTDGAHLLALRNKSALSKSISYTRLLRCAKPAPTSVCTGMSSVLRLSPASFPVPEHACCSLLSRMQHPNPLSVSSSSSHQLPHTTLTDGDYDTCPVCAGHPIPQSARSQFTGVLPLHAASPDVLLLIYLFAITAHTGDGYHKHPNHLVGFGCACTSQWSATGGWHTRDGLLGRVVALKAVSCACCCIQLSLTVPARGANVRSHIRLKTTAVSSVPPCGLGKHAIRCSTENSGPQKCRVSSYQLSGPGRAIGLAQWRPGTALVSPCN